MKGTYNAFLQHPEGADIYLLKKQNYYKVTDLISHLPMSAQVDIESGALLIIKRANLPQQEF